MSDEDRALPVIKATHEQMETDIPFSLVQKCYETQKSFMFEKDLGKPMDVTKKLVEEYVDSEEATK
ncbi:MAG: hypothetical protein H6863_03780 [Rhodospirillales bacterium]|nr:hypothetical protein [Rhodospirillales bacterium]